MGGGGGGFLSRPGGGGSGVDVGLAEMSAGLLSAEGPVAEVACFFAGGGGSIDLDSVAETVSPSNVRFGILWSVVIRLKMMQMGIFAEYRLGSRRMLDIGVSLRTWRGWSQIWLLPTNFRWSLQSCDGAPALRGQLCLVACAGSRAWPTATQKRPAILQPHLFSKKVDKCRFG